DAGARRRRERGDRAVGAVPTSRACRAARPGRQTALVARARRFRHHQGHRHARALALPARRLGRPGRHSQDQVTGRESGPAARGLGHRGAERAGPAGAAVRRPTLARAAALVVAGAALGLAINLARGSRGLRLSVAVPSVAEGGGGSAPAGPHGALPAGDAAALRGQAGVAFGDTRSPEEYARGHVAGAWHLPCFGSAQVAASSLHHLAGARTLILYGQDDAQTDARL